MGFSLLERPYTLELLKYLKLTHLIFCPKGDHPFSIREETVGVARQTSTRQDEGNLGHTFLLHASNTKHGFGPVKS